MAMTQQQILRHGLYGAATLPAAPFYSSLYCLSSFGPSRKRCFHPLCSSAHSQLTQDAVAVVPKESYLDAISSIFDAAGDSTAFQTASTVLVTGALTLFLFRSFRRRARRVREMRMRSSAGVERLKRASEAPIKAKSKPRPSPDQALIGALIAAAFGVALYKFTTTIEYTLNHQPLSNNYSVRQITISIRTIINGLCYLATFVFGFNSLGLFLYSGQLAMNSVVEVPTQMQESRDADGSGSTEVVEDQNSDKTR